MIKLKSLLTENPFDKLGGTSDANRITGGQRDPRTGNLMVDPNTPNTPEHRVLQNLKKELDSDYQSNFTLDNQTLMVSYRGRKVEIDVAKIGNNDYQYIFTDSSNGQEYEVGDAVRVEGDDTDVNEVLRLIFAGQIR